MVGRPPESDKTALIAWLKERLVEVLVPTTFGVTDEDVEEGALPPTPAEERILKEYGNNAHTW